ncbi:MAG TPA: response regulator transcription factor [Pyrinomonadaceae bacterium]|nr:response regulator transcription factor [Pyrinomonadaceae bacterium]
MISTNEKTIRILIIDDHKIIREGLRDLIESRGGRMMVVGEAGNCADGLAEALKTKPDVVLLDLDLSPDNGLTLIPELLAADKNTNILILTGVRDVEKRDQAMELGAKGIVLKEEGANELLNAIEKVCTTGEYWLEPGAYKRLLERRRPQPEPPQDPEALRIASLTEREREIIALVGEGLENKQIADRLRPVVAEATVRNNLSTIYDKLGIQGGRLGLLVYAYKHGLVSSSVKTKENT